MQVDVRAWLGELRHEVLELAKLEQKAEELEDRAGPRGMGMAVASGGGRVELMTPVDHATQIRQELEVRTARLTLRLEFATNVLYGRSGRGGLAKVRSYTDAGAYDPAKAPSSLDTVIRPGYRSRAYSDAAALRAPKPPLTPETERCVLALPREETKWGAWCPSPQAYFRGDIYMEDADYNVGWQIFTAANDMEEPHFHQGADEYIFFMGADPKNIFDFDAEIEIFIGDDPDHMESRMITEPTVVRLPPTVWHCPIRFRRMKKPLLFQAAFLHGTWGTITRADAAPGTDKGYFDRTYTYSYMGDNVRFCRRDPTKRCNVCGACFPNVEIREDAPE